MNDKLGFALMLFGIAISMGTHFGFDACWYIGLILNFFGLISIISKGEKK